MMAAQPLFPSPEEWSILNLSSDRQDYLGAGLSFEEITASIAVEVEVRSAKQIEPYETGPNKQAKTARQVIFRVKVSPKNCDLFYNAPDGLRGRYWQSPGRGFLATKHFIRALKPALLKSAVEQPPTENKGARPMTIEEVEASLDAASAKVWPYEFDADGNCTLPFKDKPQLDVRRWEANQNTAPKGPLWRWNPDDRDLEIKGALLDPEGREYVPEGKRDRSSHIHLYGFT